MKNIILASGSPRRRELLKQIGMEFQVIVSDCDENLAETDAENYVRSLSRRKASAVADGIVNGKLQPEGYSDSGYLVIGADTIVVLGGRILGKPASKEDAFKTLRALSGKTHLVYTAVSVIDTQSQKHLTFAEKTEVTMYDLSDREIIDYIATKEPMDKAGSYGIQGRGAALVKKINGDYFNVVGLPIARLIRELDALL